MEEPKTLQVPKSVRDRRATWQAVLIGLIMVGGCASGVSMEVQPSSWVFTLDIYTVLLYTGIKVL
jgi:hypothetical protein